MLSKSTLLAGAAFALTALSSLPAAADPLVYSCEIFDYLATGVERTEFLYKDVGHSVTRDSAHSTARVYLDDDRRLVISLRPHVEGQAPSFYSTATGFGLPGRLEVVLANGTDDDGYAARLVCIF